MPSMLSKISIGLAASAGIYAIILGTALTAPIQRFAFYANAFNTLFLHNVNRPETFGFATNQVTPFDVHTPDGEMLYAWHVLPVDVYLRNERALREEKRHEGPSEDFKLTKAFRLLAESQDARVVISFHGNAGHIAQAWRPDTYRYLSTQPNTHVIAVDYRGFGKSSGTPTEAGLIADGVAVVNWVLHTAHIPPERIVILGQSLGTAVASAVGLEFADPENELRPSGDNQLMEKARQVSSPVTFAGIILVAPFSSVPSLLLTYRMGGLLPILLPLRPFPSLAKALTANMTDKWPTADRLASYYAALTKSPKLIGEGGRSMGRLQILHATDDRDISYHQTGMICRRMFDGDDECSRLDEEGVLEVMRDERPKVRFEILVVGGHNRVITHSPVAVAVNRAFEDVN